MTLVSVVTRRLNSSLYKAVMMHRTLSGAGIESGSSFRMTQLLLPQVADTTTADHGSSTTVLSHRPSVVADLLDRSTPSDVDVARRQTYHSQDNFSDAAWQTAVKLESSGDYQRLQPQRYFGSAVYRDTNTNGQSLHLIP